MNHSSIAKHKKVKIYHPSEKTIQTLHPQKTNTLSPESRVACIKKEENRTWKKKHPSIFSIYMENKLLLISINCTPKTCHSCLKKWYFPMFSR